MRMQKRKVLVLGEFGAFGRRIGAALSRSPLVECLLGVDLRRKGARRAREIGATVIPVDINDAASMRRALDGVFAVVNTSGPFHARDYRVAEACADLGVHYVDPAETREHVANIAQLARRAEKSGSLIVSGAAAVPAVSAALVDLMRGEFDRIGEIHTFVSPGRGDRREVAAVRAVLAYDGGPKRSRERGRARQRPETVHFPPPVGRRRGYLCAMPDLDLFPRRYGAQTVTCRIGPPTWFNRLVIAGLGRVRRRGLIENLPRAAALLLRSGGPGLGRGRVGAGMRVLIHGQKGGQPVSHSIYLMARDASGPAISAAPAIALVKQWVGRGVPQAGAMPAVGLLAWDDIKTELMGYDIVLVRA